MMGEARSDVTSRETNRLSLGAVAGRLRDELQVRAVEATKRAGREFSLRLISAHDTTVLPLLTALGLWEGDWPPFCAAVCFELWAEDEAKGGDGSPPVVRVLYNGKGDPLSSGPFKELARWSLAQLDERVAPIVPGDVAAECARTVAPANELHTAQHGSQF